MHSFCASCVIYASALQKNAASPPWLSNFTYDVSRQTRFPRYPVVSRDTLKEGTEVQLVCCQLRASHSPLHQWLRQSQRVRVNRVKPPIPASYDPFGEI